MDMAYLLWLQDLRHSIDQVTNLVTPFLDKLSLFALTWLLFVPIFVYWCISKKNGLFLLTSLCLSWFLNGVVKLTVCAYRPWVRDSRIVPAGNAIATAGGYSFPSGHTMWSSPIYGGFAVLCRKSAKIITWLCIILIILTAFSRNYLGVHTPQDVLVGTFLGLCSVWAGSKIVGYLSARPEKENYFFVLGLILSALSIYYITHKSYPLDYVDGKLLVDPWKMMHDTFHADGMLAGFVVGRFIEKNFVKFEAASVSFTRVLLSIIGLVPLYFCLVNVVKSEAFLTTPLQSIFGQYWGFGLGFLESIYVVAIWPAVMKIFVRK